MRTRSVLLVLSIVFVAACGGESTGGGMGGGTGGGTGSFDAGKKDAGTAKTDAGKPVDAGQATADSGTVDLVDAGPVGDAGQPDAGSSPDAGVPAVDAGQPAVDAGQPGDAGQPAVDSGQPVDAGQPDAGTPDAGQPVVDAGQPDAGQPVVDAGPPDAGSELLAWVPLIGPRRGPIELRFTVAADAGFQDFVLTVDKGSGLVAATVLTKERTATDVTLVWDSFADITVDATVSLKLGGLRGVDVIPVVFTLDVRNGLDPARLISVAQAYLDGPGGGTTLNGTGVTLLKWDPAGSTAAPRRFNTVTGVQYVRAAPHGRSTAVLGAASVVLVHTPLDANPANASLSAATPLPGAPTDIRWSRDGRYLYVLCGLDMGRAPTLERLRVKEDQSAIEAPVTVVTFDRPPMHFDIDRTTGRFVIVVGSGSAVTGKLLLLEQDGGAAATPLDRDWSVPNALTVSPLGDLAVISSHFFGDQLFIVNLGPSGFGSVLERNDVLAPYDISFDPRSTSTSRTFVVANQDSNGITSVTYDTAGVTVRPKTSISFAIELDMIERGTRVGTGFSTASERIYRFVVGADGVIGTPALTHRFDGGTIEDPSGVAIQR